MRIVLFEDLIEKHVRASLARALQARGHDVLAPPPFWRGWRLPSSPKDRAACQEALDVALAWRPDVLFNFRASALPAEDVARCRSAGVRTVVWLNDDAVLYASTYRHVVEAYDLVLNCGEAEVVDFYARRHGVHGVNFPFFTDDTACPPATVPKAFDIAFLGHCFGDVRSRRYDIIAGLPGEKRIFGQIDSDPQNLGAGYERDHDVLMTRLSAARIGFSIPQLFQHYWGSELNFPGLARLGSFPVPSRVVQYAALGLPILTYGRATPPPWFPEMAVGADGQSCATVASRLLASEDELRSVGAACRRRFELSYAAERRAAFLDWLIGRESVREHDVAARVSLYDTFDRAPPHRPSRRAERSDLEVLRAEAPAIDTPVTARILSIGPRNAPLSSPLSAHLRALRALGHTVVHVEAPTRDPPGRTGAGLSLDADAIGRHAHAMSADVVFCFGGAFSLDETAAHRLRATGLGLVQITLSEQDASAAAMGNGRFDLLCTSSAATVARCREIGTGDVHYMPPAVDRAWVTAEVPPSEAFEADVVCFSGDDAHSAALMREIGARFERVRLYSPQAFDRTSRPDRDIDVLRAARGGLIHVHIPRLVNGSPILDSEVFAAIGAGGILLTKRCDELGRAFDCGTEVLEFTDADHVMAVIERLLANPDERMSIRRRAMTRLVTQHLYEHRWLAAWPHVMATCRPARTALPADQPSSRVKVVVASLDAQGRATGRLDPAVVTAARRAEVAAISAAQPVDGVEWIDPANSAGIAAAIGDADALVLDDSGGLGPLKDALSATAAAVGTPVVTPASLVDLAAGSTRTRTRQPAAALPFGPLTASPGPGLSWPDAPPRFEVVQWAEEVGPATVALTDTGLTTVVTGAPGATVLAEFKLEMSPGEPPTAVVVQFGVPDDDAAPKNAYGTLTRQLGRVRFLPRSGRLRIAVPPAGWVHLTVRRWRNEQPVLIARQVRLSWSPADDSE